MEISIVGYDGIALITSPRSLEACDKAGINADELMKKEIESYADELK